MLWLLAQIETAEKVNKSLTDQIYNQPINWVITYAALGLLGFCAFLLLRAFRQADRTAKEKGELEDTVLKMAKESVEALTQVKLIVSDLRGLMSADVEATKRLADKIGEQNGEIKSIGVELRRRRGN
jgi:predicted transcriptional regulator